MPFGHLCLLSNSISKGKSVRLFCYILTTDFFESTSKANLSNILFINNLFQALEGPLGHSVCFSHKGELSHLSIQVKIRNSVEWSLFWLE